MNGSTLAWVQLVLFILSVLAMIGALGWRSWQRRRTARHFQAMLHDPQAEVRMEAIGSWIRYGLHRSAPDLLALAHREPDPAVLDALADAVRARAWEPTSRPQIAQLRQWASERHAASPD